MKLSSFWIAASNAFFNPIKSLALIKYKINSSLTFYFWVDSSIIFSYKWWYFLWKGWMSWPCNEFKMNFLKVTKSLIFYLIASSSIFFNYLYSRLKFIFFSSLLSASKILRPLIFPKMFPIMIKFETLNLFSFNFDFKNLIKPKRSWTLLSSLLLYAFLKASYSMYRKFSKYFCLYSLAKIF